MLGYSTEKHSRLEKTKVGRRGPIGLQEQKAVDEGYYYTVGKRK